MIKGRKGRAVAAKQLPPMFTALRAKPVLGLIDATSNDVLFAVFAMR